MKAATAATLMFILACSPLLVQAENMTLEIITLQHRNTDDVVSILQPLVAPGGTVTGMNDQLIIKTTPENMAELKHVLASLDRTPRRLLISVRQDNAGMIRGQRQTLAGKFSGGDVTTEVNDPAPAQEGMAISAHDEKGNVVQYRRQDFQADASEQNSYRVQATEGFPAFISVGQSVPVPNSTTYVTPNGVVVNNATEYVDVTSGFYVLPRLNGDQVTLLVAPRQSKAATGGMPVFDVQNVETTATGRLGEWLEVGGINQGSSGKGYRTLSSSNREEQVNNSVFIKVDEMK